MIFDPDQFISQKTDELKKFEGKSILSAVSGGVDSTTSSLLIQKAKLALDCLIVDTGFLRKDEIERVVKLYQKTGLNLIKIDMSGRFFKALKGISEPVAKREVFRETYFDVLIEYLEKNKYDCLVQGTQFEQIGFVGRHSNNHVTSSFKMTNKLLIEPVAGLTKDKIRSLAKQLGAPAEIVKRRPFPGPGLLIRFSGSYNPKKLQTIREATDRVEQCFKNDVGIYQIVVYLLSGAKIPYIDTSGNGGFGDILLIKLIDQEVNDDNICYKPYWIEDKVIEELTCDLMAIPGIARVCFDSTIKRGFGSNVKHGGTIEYI